MLGENGLRPCVLGGCKGAAAFVQVCIFPAACLCVRKCRLVVQQVSACSYVLLLCRYVSACMQIHAASLYFSICKFVLQYLQICTSVSTSLQILKYRNVDNEIRLPGNGSAPRQPCIFPKEVRAGRAGSRRPTRAWPSLWRSAPRGSRRRAYPTSQTWPHGAAVRSRPGRG